MLQTTSTCCAFVTGLFATIASPAGAETIEPGLYQLGNHPDGNAAAPHYGFRLDELFNVSGGHDIFTFDFEHAASNMKLEYDGTSIHIFGTAFGGLDTGSTHDPDNSSKVYIDFTYDLVGLAPGDDDLIVTTPNFENIGTITWLETGDEIDLYDYAGNHGYTFRFGDTDSDNGHRGFDGLSGWGWVDHHEPGTHVAASDWLFTATAVPVPPAALLGVAGLIAVRHRMKRRSSIA